MSLLIRAALQAGTGSIRQGRCFFPIADQQPVTGGLFSFDLQDMSCIRKQVQEMPFIPFSGDASGLAGTVKKRFRIKYFPPDLHIRDCFGFPEPVKRPVTDVQQLLNVCAVIISGAAGLFFVQTFKNFGKENQECPFKLFFIRERMIEFCFHRSRVIS